MAKKCNAFTLLLGNAKVTQQQAGPKWPNTLDNCVFSRFEMTRPGPIFAHHMTYTKKCGVSTPSFPDSGEQINYRAYGKQKSFGLAHVWGTLKKKYPTNVGYWYMYIYIYHLVI